MIQAVLQDRQDHLGLVDLQELLVQDCPGLLALQVQQVLREQVFQGHQARQDPKEVQEVQDQAVL